MDDRDVEPGPHGPSRPPAASERKHAADGPEASAGLPGADATSLDAVEAARWDAARRSIAGLADAVQEGRVSPDDVAATAAQLGAIDVDLGRVLDAIHVPDDAGEWASGLERILRRIPDGWGRWVSVGPGWYGLVCELDADLAAIDPGYIVHQVKEKFGTLRYYFASSPAPPLPCCLAWDESHPAPSADADADEIAEWDAADTAHRASPKHEEAEEAGALERLRRQERFEAMEARVAEAELRSAEVCERTGGLAVPISAGGWIAALDPVEAPPSYTTICPGSTDESWDWQTQRVADDLDAWRRLADGQRRRANHLEALCQHLLDALRETRREGGEAEGATGS